MSNKTKPISQQDLTTESVLAIGDIQDSLDIVDPSDLQEMVSNLLNQRIFVGPLDVATYKTVMLKTLDKIINDRRFDGVIETLANKRAEIYEALPETKVAKIIQDLHDALPKYLALPDTFNSTITLGEAVTLTTNIERKSFEDYETFLRDVLKALETIEVAKNDLDKLGDLEVDGRIDNIVKEGIIEICHRLNKTLASLSEDTPKGMRGYITRTENTQDVVLPDSYKHTDLHTIVMGTTFTYTAQISPVKVCTLIPAWGVESVSDTTVKKIDREEIRNLKKQVTYAISTMLNTLPKAKKDDYKTPILRSVLLNLLYLTTTVGTIMKNNTFSNILDKETRKVAKYIADVIY